MEKIILDTNFLLIPGQFNVDIFKEMQIRLDFTYKLYILDLIEKELQNLLEKGKQIDKRAARIALNLIETQKIIKLDTKNKTFIEKYGTGSTDDILVKMSSDYIIATNDSELKKKLKGKIIILKQKKYLELR